jgi:hypothetical protein
LLRLPSGSALIDFSVAERVKRFDCGGNAVFLLDILASGSNFACTSGKINKALVPAER